MSGFAIPCQRNDIYHRIEESRAVGRLPMRGTRFAEVIEIIEKGQSLYRCVTEVQLGKLWPLIWEVETCRAENWRVSVQGSFSDNSWIFSKKGIQNLEFRDPRNTEKPKSSLIFESWPGNFSTSATGMNPGGHIRTAWSGVSQPSRLPGSGSMRTSKVSTILQD